MSEVRLDICFSHGKLRSECGCAVPADKEECEANARLIAIAPELLEACKSMIEWCTCSTAERDSGHHVDCYVPAVKLLIAKAEGR